MTILIDAYNILKQVIKTDFIKESEKMQFIKQMEQYARLKSHNIIIVFDRGPYDRTTTVKKSGIKVVFSGPLQTADDYIQEYIEINKNHLLVVSSDRSLVAFAKLHQVNSFASLKFYALVQEALNAQEKMGIKEARVKAYHDAQAIDELMLQASAMPIIKENESPERHLKRKGKAYTPSKKEKRLLTLLRKLE